MSRTGAPIRPGWLTGCLVLLAASAVFFVLLIVLARPEEAVVRRILATRWGFLEGSEIL